MAMKNFRKTTWKKRYAGKGKRKFTQGRWKKTFKRKHTLGTNKAIFPKSLYTTFRYQDLVQMSNLAAAPGQLAYAINSVYDPYNPLGGHQPRYLDTLLGADNTSAPYNKYRVYGMKIKATLWNPNTSGNTCGVFYMHARDAAGQALGSPATIDLYEVPNTVSANYGPINSKKGIVSLTKYWNVKSLHGVKDVADDDGLAGTYATNPADLYLVDVGYQPLDQTVATNVQVQIRIKYYVQLFEQNFPLAS